MTRKRTVALLALALGLLASGAPALAETPSPTPWPHSCPPWESPSLSILTPTITSGALGKVRIRGDAGDAVQLYEKQAQHTDYVARGHFASDGPTSTDVQVRPRTNALYRIVYSGGGPAREAGRPTDCHVPYYDGASPQPLTVAVSTVLRLTGATRTATGAYVFTGTNAGHAGDLVNLYRVDAAGRSVLTGQAEAGTDGTYRIGHRFTGTGTLDFYTASPADPANASGRSTVVPFTIR